MLTKDARSAIATLGTARWIAQVVDAHRAIDIRQLLRAVGFQRDGRGSGWTWTVEHAGQRMVVDAMPEWIGPQWILSARSRNARMVMLEQRLVAGRDARGRLAATLLGFWREAFGADAPVPAGLEAAVAWQAHRAVIDRLNPGLPHVLVDADRFRAALRWLRRHRSHDGLPPTIRLDFLPGQLLLVTADEHFTVEASGVWVDPCSVLLDQLLALPPHAVRGAIRLEHDGQTLRVNGYPVPVLAKQSPTASKGEEG